MLFVGHYYLQNVSQFQIHVCVCVCVRACVRACVFVCVCARARLCTPDHNLLNGSERKLTRWEPGAINHDKKAFFNFFVKIQFDSPHHH